MADVVSTPNLRSNYGYVTFNPNGVANVTPYATPGQTGYGAPSTPGGVGWIAPEAVKANPNGNSYINYGAANPIDSDFYNRFPTVSFNKTAGTGDQANNPFAGTPASAAPNPMAGNPGANNAASQGAINSLANPGGHNLKNRKPTLDNSWGGWQNGQNTTDTNPPNNGFTFFSKFA